MCQPIRLLVTGSRTGDDTAVIEHALAVIVARHSESSPDGHMFAGPLAGH